jgi:recombination protein RecT
MVQSTKRNPILKGINTMATDLLTKHEGWTDEQYKSEYGTMWEAMKSQDTFLHLTPDEQKRVREAQSLALAEKKTALDKIRAYAEMEEVKKRFINLLGEQEGRAYVESVVIAVSNNESLQACTPKSIMIAAMRAASLKLSVDPIMEQAHLGAFGNTATLIPDYHGLVQMSVNTNYYEIAPNVFEVYKGEIVKTDRFSGRITIEGERISDEVIGWCAYYKAKNGIERWLYMTNEECDEHAKIYNPGGYASKDSPWNNKGNANRDKMRRKTCLRIFIKRWGNFSPIMQRFIMTDETPIEAEFEDLPSDQNIVIPPQEEKSKGVIEWLMETQHIDHEAHATNISNLLKMTDKMPNEVRERRYSNYRALRDSGLKELEAAQQAIAKEIGF